MAEKDFTFSEEMNLSPGREGAAEILTSRVHSYVTETKIVGSKLLFKGVFTVSLLYRTGGGRCCAASGELPFSQIMEVEGAPEGAAAIGAPAAHRRGSADRRRRRRRAGRSR